MKTPTLSFLLALWASPLLLAQGGTPFFVQDLNQIPREKAHGSNPRFWTGLSGKVLFTAETLREGREIFVTQGTSASTKILKVLRPGTASANPQFLGKVGKLAFFSADDGISGKEVWVSDGTNLGTHIAVETGPGPSSAFQYGLGIAGPYLFFLVRGSGQSRELWRTDGTSKGTTRVLSITPTPQEGLVFFNQVKKTNRGFLFFVSTKIYTTLYLSDGTAAGTKVVTRIPFFPYPGPYSIPMESDGKRIFFAAYDPLRGTEAWVSDGTKAGTKVLKDLVAGKVGSDPRHFQVWNNRMTFIAWDPQGTRKVIWISDGTGAGTKILGPKQGNAVRFQVLGVHALLSVGRRFGATPPWIYAPGRPPIQVQIPRKNLIYNPTALLSSKGLILSVFEGAKMQLWTVDLRTGKGTFLAPWIYPILDPNPGLFVGGKTYMVGRLPINRVFLEPYISDGTSKGTTLLKELYPSPGTNSVEQLFAFSLGNSSFFFGRGVGIPVSHWGWKGPSLPAKLLGSWKGANLSPWKDSLTPQAGFAFAFIDSGRKLYRLDATPPYQTLLYSDSRSFQNNESPLLALLGGKLFFQHEIPETNGFSAELFVSDGTAKGTSLFKDIVPGPAGSAPSRLKTLGNRLFFAATQPGTGEEPWTSDGTQGGTKILQDLVPGNKGSGPHHFVRWDGRAWFLARDAKLPISLPHFTNPEATKVQGALRSQLFPNGLGPLAALFPAGGTLFVSDPLRTNSLLAISQKGTGYQVKILPLTLTGLTALSILPLGQKALLLFSPLRQPGKGALWISDGTLAGTKLLTLVTRSQRSPLPLLRLGTRRAIFRNKGQLWTTDGTLKGTAPISGNPPYQNPRPLAYSQGLLLFAAEDPVHGIEPWAWFPGAHGVARGQGCGGKVLQTPELEVEDPVLGQSFAARGEAAPKNAAGLLLLGTPGTASLRLPSRAQLPCRIFLDFTRFWTPLPPFSTSPQGTWTQKFQAPNSLALAGITVMLQALYPRSRGLFEVSNGYEMTFGK